MPDNLDIDDDLIDEALRVGKHATKEEGVTVALQEYITRHRQRQILDLFGTIDFDPQFEATSTPSSDSRNKYRIGR